MCACAHDFIFILYGHKVEHKMDQVVSLKCAVLRYGIHTVLQTASPHASRNMIPTKRQSLSVHSPQCLAVTICLHAFGDCKRVHPVIYMES